MSVLHPHERERVAPVFLSYLGSAPPDRLDYRIHLTGLEHERVVGHSQLEVRQLVEYAGEFVVGADLVEKSIQSTPLP